jgi:hypothetical protein
LRQSDHYWAVDQRVAVIVFSSVLLAICLFWTYGYIRKRARERY